MNFKPGDIFFVMHNGSKLSRLMAWFMQSKWSHSGLIYEPTDRTIYTLETSDYEVTHQDFNTYINDSTVNLEVWSPVSLSDSDRLAVTSAAVLVEGDVYGYLQLLSLGLKDSLKRLGIKISNLLQIGVICCDVVIYGYAASNMQELHIDPRSIDTQDLYEIVINSGKFIKVFEK